MRQGLYLHLYSTNITAPAEPCRGAFRAVDSRNREQIFKIRNAADLPMYFVGAAVVILHNKGYASMRKLHYACLAATPTSELCRSQSLSG
jgi:hypothetical protein